MTWTTELHEAFVALRQGHSARVAFDSRDDRVGDLGREFNRLADALAAKGSSGFTREQAHKLRNCLAGILAVLHVLRVTGESPPEEQEALARIVAEAKELDTRLRAG